MHAPHPDAAELEARFRSLATKLSDARGKVAKRFGNEVSKLLGRLAMPKARFIVGLTPAPPVLVLTGKSGDDVAEDVRAMGGQAYLAKPFDWSQLLRTIDSLTSTGASAPSGE